jgi:hypothetical protein
MKKPLPLLIQAFRRPADVLQFALEDWDLALRQAATGRLEAALAALLDEHGLLGQIPAQAREQLAWTDAQSARHRQAVDWEVRCIGQALAATGVPVILLKGAAYAAAGLPPARGRMFTDVDILVPKERLEDVESALMQHGWIGTHHDAYDQRYYREWMHELPPMQHSKRAAYIDVHHAILPATAAAHPDPAKLRAAAVPLAGQARLAVLAPVDMVLHSAVHLFYDGEYDHGLRDLADIHRLLNHFGAIPGFWEALAPRARELEVARPLFYALRYSGALLATPIPAATLAAAAFGRPNALLLRLMDGLFLRALLPDHASCDTALTGAARFCLYIRANWLRMPPLMLARHLFHKAFLSPKKANA